MTDRPDRGFYLRREARGLVLYRAHAPAGDRGLCMDLLDADSNRRQRAGKRTPLARALGLHRHPACHVLDATCGLGRDAATLAGLGCRVTALERHAVLYALLADARRRADAVSPAWLDNWPELHHVDAGGWLAARPDARFDVVYLDPMFTAERRKARPQKALAWLGDLVGPDRDAADLLARARRHATRAVVVKQHARAAPLGEPMYQVRGRAVRFDRYAPAG